MTNNLERVIGEGGFGIVYHGYLNDTEQVAVKVLSPSSSQGYKQFKAEVIVPQSSTHSNALKRYNLSFISKQSLLNALYMVYMVDRLSFFLEFTT